MAKATAVALKLFGWQSESKTKINQLVVNNSLFSLENQSKDFFEILDNNRNNELIQRHRQYNKNEHSRYVINCTNMFRFKSDVLRNLDKKILLSIALSITAAFLSFIPFVGLFSSILFLYSTYLYAERVKAEDEYRTSLNLLVATCNWSLGYIPKESNRVSRESSSSLASDLTIREMMACLYSVLDEQQIRDLIDDGIEDIFVKELEDYNNATNDSGSDNIARSKRSSEFLRCIYGYNKGNALDAIDAIIAIYPDIRDATVDSLRQLHRWWNKGAQSEENADEQRLNPSI